MSIFQGQPTAAAEAKAPLYPRFTITASKRLLTRENFEWVDTDPTTGRRTFQLYVSAAPLLAGGFCWTVYASLGASDSMRRIVESEAKALEVFNAVNDWTMAKTLENRGFRRW